MSKSFSAVIVFKCAYTKIFQEYYYKILKFILFSQVYLRIFISVYTFNYRRQSNAVTNYIDKLGQSFI